MGLFGSKSSKPGAVVHAHSDLAIQKIPDLFYGGNNPLIYEPKTSSSDFQSMGGTPKPPTSEVEHSPVRVHKSKIIWGISILGILVLCGASAYYIMEFRGARPPSITSTLPKENIVETQTPTLSVITTSSISTIATSSLDIVSSTPSLTSNFLEFPPFNLGTTADIDLDQLTDIEEVLYRIDSGTWDTDSDGYYDGQEVVNLYNPQGVAPVKLIDSGLILEYINSLTGYRIYYPLQWSRGSVDPRDNHVLFSSATGEFTEVRVFEKNASTTFAEWFQKNAPQEQFSQLIPFTNRFEVPGMRRSDGLVTYFDTEQYVFVMIYHQGDERSPISYRSTFEMMYQSFRPTQTTRTLPDQPPLVIPTDVTST